ncbi:MAG: hypothetical protein M1819_006115 [Sarea resinae]|nr:MAG: hypothetical protein M1819_006115 [Sarea resinae]
MSSDLLAEFDSFYQKSKAPLAQTDSGQQRHSFFDDLSSLNQPTSSNALQPTQNARPAGPHVQAPIASTFGKPGPREEAPSRQQDPDPWDSFEPFQSSVEPTPASQKRQSYPAPVSQDPWTDFSAMTSAVGAGGFQQPSAFHQPSSRPFSADLTPSGSFRGSSAQAKGGFSPNKVDPWGFQSAPGSKDSTGNVDVLFDATDPIPDDDEFGDFESGEASILPPSAPPKQAGISSSGSNYNPYSQSSLTPMSPSLPQSSNQKQPPFQQQSSLSKFTTSTNATAGAGQFVSPISKASSFSPAKIETSRSMLTRPTKQEDEWGDFIESPSTEKPPDLPPKYSTTEVRSVASQSSHKSTGSRQKTLPQRVPFKQDDPFNWSPTQQSTNPQSEGTSRPSNDSFDWSPTPQPLPQPTDDSRPSNIPPPSVLLPLFPPLFDLLRSRLSEPLSSQSHVIRNRILSDSSTATFLRGYLSLATVAARIIAGRKLRWKRDTLLAQSTRIGPARSGHAGGMKLTTVDKAETRREEREIADVVRAWKEQLGRLRAAVAAANTSDPAAVGAAPIPDIQENPPVKLLRESEGAVSAPQPCALCGLRRDERVERVDPARVEDSFGEWWVDYWGHTACRNFWEEHRGKLSQR